MSSSSSRGSLKGPVTQDIPSCIKYREESKSIFENLVKLHKTILDTRRSILSQTRNVIDPGNFYFLNAKMKILDQLYQDVVEGLHSLRLIIEFMGVCNVFLKQEIMYANEEKYLRDSMTTNGNKFIRMSGQVSMLSNQFEFQSAFIDHITFVIYIQDPYYFNRDPIEEDIWQLATFNDLEDGYIHLPEFLWDVKTYCNVDEDNPDYYIDMLEVYCSERKRDIKLPMRLSYIAKKFFECRNYKGSLAIQNLALQVLKQSKNYRADYYSEFLICKGLILARMNEEGMMDLFAEALENLDYDNDSLSNERKIFMGKQLMNLSGVLASYGYVDSAIYVLVNNLKKMDALLPVSYDYWLDNLLLLTRFYNDDGQFKRALMIAAQGIDYFHLSNFGKINEDSKPIYEVARDLTKKTRVKKITKQIKYPSYLPVNISNLMYEMMIGFSGLGDKTSMILTQNWLDRCEKLSGNYTKMLIDQFEVYTTPDNKVLLERFRANRLRYHEIFTDQDVFEEFTK